MPSSRRGKIHENRRVRGDVCTQDRRIVTMLTKTVECLRDNNHEVMTFAPQT